MVVVVFVLFVFVCFFVCFVFCAWGLERKVTQYIPQKQVHKYNTTALYTLHKNKCSNTNLSYCEGREPILKATVISQPGNDVTLCYTALSLFVHERSCDLPVRNIRELL